MNDGYQPNKGYLNPKNPPKGGSGVPNKIIKGEMVITEKMKELEKAKEWFYELNDRDKIELLEVYYPEMIGDIADLYKYLDDHYKIEMYQENRNIY